jgi:hypothetical protein
MKNKWARVAVNDHRLVGHPEDVFVNTEEAMKETMTLHKVAAMQVGDPGHENRTTMLINRHGSVPPAVTTNDSRNYRRTTFARRSMRGATPALSLKPSVKSEM